MSIKKATYTLAISSHHIPLCHNPRLLYVGAYVPMYLWAPSSLIQFSLTSSWDNYKPYRWHRIRTCDVAGSSGPPYNHIHQLEGATLCMLIFLGLIPVFWDCLSDKSPGITQWSACHVLLFNLNVTGVVLPHSRSDLYSRCNYKVTSTYRTPCSLVASSTSATVTIAHRIIFTYQKEVECRCACGRYLIILIYHVFRPRKFENRLNIKASIQFLEEFVS